jgi:hypothetical protein
MPASFFVRKETPGSSGKLSVRLDSLTVLAQPTPVGATTRVVEARLLVESV